jgi:hypothetical protein
MEFHDFNAEGFVSIWVSEYPNDADSDEYFEANYDKADDEPLAPWMGEFGFGYFDYDSMDTNGHGESIGPLRPLIEACSYAASFVDEAMQMAAQLGIAETQWVMLLYDFCYDPAVTGVTQGKYLRFLGAFPYAVERQE